MDLARSLETRSEAPRFRALFEAEFSYVFHTLYRLGVRRADLEDLTHEVFVTVHRLLPEYDETRPLRPWLFGIAFRIASDYRRRARFAREVPRGEAGDVASDTPGADDQLEAEQARRLVIEALHELDLDRRAVLVMHDIDGCPVPEIAHALSIPVNTAYSRLRLGREQLKAAIKRIRLRRGEP
ncbi:RNA polymerase sigma factor RpoE [Minicystis rosea]|nr:RNA polymerase sigma factor RpoE [Minicystis rosea]